MLWGKAGVSLRVEYTISSIFAAEVLSFFSPCPALHYFASLVLLDIIYTFLYDQTKVREL